MKTSPMDNQKIKNRLKKKKVFFLSKMSELSFYEKTYPLFKNAIIVCDRSLKRQKGVQNWLQNRLVYFVPAGEFLKDLKNFNFHIRQIIRKTKNQTLTGWISLGGGSVGDLTGFCASIWSRGMPLVHIPSTWLAGIDSAHGGKTALNSMGIKNLLGTYHFPQAVFIVKELFSSLPKQEVQNAQGELLKMAFIEGGSFYSHLQNTPLPLTFEQFWQILPQTVLSKLKIVEKDPWGKKNIRKKLNLGHTIGHILESHFHLPHGEAILYGLLFSLRWSQKKFKTPKTTQIKLENNILKFLSPRLVSPKMKLSTQKPSKKFLNFDLLTELLKKISLKKFQFLLLKDKKIPHSLWIHFVWLKKPGCVMVKKIPIAKVLKEFKIQKTFFK